LVLIKKSPAEVADELCSSPDAKQTEDTQVVSVITVLGGRDDKLHPEGSPLVGKLGSAL
jgi:hypothetical protein